MSDYLWDKTGEPEEDVERLEELLGRLRFQPRTFEVPATLPVVPRRAGPPASTFPWPRLALAASLALTLLAGAWLVLTKQRAPVTTTQTAARGSAPGTTTAQQHQPTTGPTARQSANRLPSGSGNDAQSSPHRGRSQREVAEQPNARNALRNARVESAAVERKRPALPVRQLTVRDENATREQIAGGAPLTREEREAMEKFLLAMRVTSEKLTYAEREVQGMRESSPQR